MNSKISIIVPAYNVEKELERTVESILQQTYKNIEIIIVNDGSIDRTEDVIKKLMNTDSRIVSYQQLNSGVTAARLSGVRISTGDLIGFVDADDVIEPNMYEHLISNMQQFNADISHCGYKMIFPDGRCDEYYNTGKLKVQNNVEGIIDLLEGKFVEPGLCNKLFQKTLLLRLLDDEIMNLDIKINEDLLMNYYLFKNANQSVYEDFCPYCYMVRVNSAATSKSNINKLMDPIKVTQIIMDDVERNTKLYNIVYIKYIRQLIGKATMSVNDNINLKQPIRDYARKELRKKIRKFDCSKNNVIKIKIMVLWVIVFPSSYRWIHDIYSRITGNDKKYDIKV